MWLTLTLSSFVAFLAAMLALTRRGFAPDGSFRRGGALWMALAAISALIWAYSLSKVPPALPKNVGRYEAPSFPIKPSGK